MLERDFRWVPEHLAGQLLDRWRHRRAEEQRLLRTRNVPQHPADIRQEAHIQHPIRLVQHKILEAGKPSVVAREMVQKPPGRGDENVDTGPEGLLLRTHGDTAVDGRRAQARVSRQPDEVVSNLERQLSRGSKDECAGRATRTI